MHDVRNDFIAFHFIISKFHVKRKSQQLPYKLKFEEVVGNEPLKDYDCKVQLFTDKKPARIMIVFIIQVFLKRFE